jgi:hypothetical protein
MATLNVAQHGGFDGLEKALGLRMYSLINHQHLERPEDGKRLRFVMDVCRVQETRRRKGLQDFPCKSVGTIEFATFARTIDPRIRTTCLHCPPDTEDGKYCAWEFSLAEDELRPTCVQGAVAKQKGATSSSITDC